MYSKKLRGSLDFISTILKEVLFLDFLPCSLGNYHHSSLASRALQLQEALAFLRLFPNHIPYQFPVPFLTLLPFRPLSLFRPHVPQLILALFVLAQQYELCVFLRILQLLQLMSKHCRESGTGWGWIEHWRFLVLIFKGRSLGNISEWRRCRVYQVILLHLSVVADYQWLVQDQNHHLITKRALYNVIYRKFNKKPNEYFLGC